MARDRVERSAMGDALISACKYLTPTQSFRASLRGESKIAVTSKLLSVLSRFWKRFKPIPESK